jgi:hypothetical protein
MNRKLCKRLRARARAATEGAPILGKYERHTCTHCAGNGRVVVER